MAQIDFSDDASLLREAVREAGLTARHYFGRDLKVERKEERDEPVTKADIEVDRFLRETLTAARPDYGWLSEESVDDKARLTKTRVWIVDPIDGTRAFIRHAPEWVVAAALVEDGRPLFGVIYDPVSDEMFEAGRGTGALLNGDAINVTGATEIEGARLIAYGEFIRSKRWAEPWPAVKTNMVNSSALRMALVAAGRFDGMFSINGKSDWDLAAADIIVREAGGVASDRYGESFRYNRESTRHKGMIAAPPALHARLAEKLKQWRPRRR